MTEYLVDGSLSGPNYETDGELSSDGWTSRAKENIEKRRVLGLYVTRDIYY
jgi:hypothetical protein